MDSIKTKYRYRFYAVIQNKSGYNPIVDYLFVILPNKIYNIDNYLLN